MDGFNFLYFVTLSLVFKSNIQCQINLGPLGV